MSRKILHLDMDAFFCSVEELHNPALRGKPFAVGARPDQRGVVASCSYAARQFGVHSAMPMSQAVKLCPDLIVIPNRRGLYSETSKRVMDYLRSLTPLLEQLSIDEAFLDVTARPEPAEALAHEVQDTINTQFNLPCSLGVAANKLVAKIANTVGKRTAKRDGPPNAIQVVLPGEEAAFLAPLSVRDLWGVGPKTAEQLAHIGIQTIGDLAQRHELELVQRFGKNGYDLARRSRGIDERQVEPVSETKSVSRETTFERDVRSEETLRRTLLELSESVGRELRQEGLRGSTIKIKLRWADFTTLTRQQTLKGPTDQDVDILQAALALFDKTWEHKRPVRLVGVGVSNFGPVQRQLELWDVTPMPDAPVPSPLQTTLKQLQKRFGEQAIRRGSDLKGKQKA
jgi:DNA polymerase-4